MFPIHVIKIIVLTTLISVPGVCKTSSSTVVQDGSATLRVTVTVERSQAVGVGIGGVGSGDTAATAGIIIQKGVEILSVFIKH